MNEHQENCSCSLCSLSALDSGTEWKLDGNMLSVNDYTDDDDEDDDDGLAGVPSNLVLLPTGDAHADSMTDSETVENIVNTVRDMSKNGDLSELIVIANTNDDRQLLFTTLDRNDHIIGMLTVATLNWHSSQIAAQNYLEEEDV